MDRAMAMRLMKIAFLAFAFCLMTGCGSDECGFPLDQIKFADKLSHNDKEYFVYIRTVGWHDKVVFFELYDINPIFDDCRQTNTKYLYKIDYDDYPESKYVKELILQPDQAEKLKIIYTKNKNESFASIYDVKFSR